MPTSHFTATPSIPIESGGAGKTCTTRNSTGNCSPIIKLRFWILPLFDTTPEKIIGVIFIFVSYL
jgi:hypothetical protein